MKVALISLGCAKNLINSEQMLFLLSEAGFETVSSPDVADAAVVNTCGFITSAKEEAISTILELAELKAAGKLGAIVVAGCLAERHRDEILNELPEVDALVGVGSFGEIVRAVRDALRGQKDGGEKACFFGDKNAPVEETERMISTGPGWAYIKIAEGCDNRCAYCAIPDIRGKYRSRPMESIISEAEVLAEAGVKELIVVAQDTTRYGLDLYRERRLSELLRGLCAIDGLQWIRLHYLYPELIDDELIETIAKEEKIVKYLDIPIQHINDRILAAMNRRGSGDVIRALFSKLRERIPELVIRTSIITGLPYEGEAEFEELYDFLHEAKIERAGVFPYSPEDGTPAASMPRPDEDVAKNRAEQIMELQGRVMDEWCERQTGKTLKVLCEGYDSESECWHGRSYADSPDVDGRVFFTGSAKTGELCDVEITGVSDGDLIGETD